MKKLPALVLVVAAAGLLLAPVAWGEMVIRLKNGVEIKVPVAQEDIASIGFEGGGKSPAPQPQSAPAPAPAAPAPVKVTGASPAYAQPPIPPSEAAAASGPALPGASTFKAGAFAPPGAATGSGESGRVIQIGKGKQYERFGDVVSTLQNGDSVEIEGGLYINDFAEITASNIRIKGINGRPHFRASVSPPNNKAIWVVSGDNVTIDNIEFSGADVGDDNGAGIRAEGGKIIIRNSYFHHNEFGFLSANIPEQEVYIANSEFAYNLRKDNYAHGIYIGAIRKFTLVNSYVHHNHRGHQVKTRAAESFILYNRLTDEDGVGSYLVDASNCGKLVVMGNVLQKGSNAENHTAIAFGAEGCKGAGHKLQVVSNTYVNGLGSGPFIKNHSGDIGVMMNNLVVGGAMYEGSMTSKNNVASSISSFVNPAAFDYRLKPGADAIDKGADAGKLDGLSLTPSQEYVHPMKARKRVVNGKLDAGAYEFTGK
ncbi:right-handed parallel beta-helix repeat-containing protein [Iodidimonas sp. SYSU 1G8]|uniref:right-handed parallel beta-helix repeat-containing protein n=1 Tax=Iodidimonas sp. SYSU 1G8 TaxID=3133967 RepID=UPI0031FE7E7F